MQQNTYDNLVRISTCNTQIFCRLQLLRRDIGRKSSKLITNEGLQLVDLVYEYLTVVSSIMSD